MLQKYYFIYIEAIHLVGILGGKSAFSEVFWFFLSILTFPLGFSLFPQYLDFSEVKVEVFSFFQRKMQYSLGFFTFSSVFWRDF